ncbi:unnamed protein product [Larinioides sclopetarius]|uniref:Uncharacterized protein n=1 Tax=Larinioides sclopetarius TaxID=280406 RepID=A0AAV1ZXT4_9ARAC
MADKKKVSYKSGLEILIKNYFPSEKVDISGLKLISELLNEVNSLLIYHIETEYSSVGKVNGQTFQHCARKAIDENFPGKLKENAFSEAYKQLALLESGCIVYKKDATEVKGKMENHEDTEFKRIEVPIRMFKKGIEKMFSVMFPNFQVDSKAVGPLALYIHEFSKMVAKRAPEKAPQKDELQPIDIKNVLPEYFGNNALRVALGEANRCLALYEKGLIEFEPKVSYKTGPSQDKEVSKKISPTIFQPGIRNLLSEIIPGCETEARGKRYLAHILTDIAQYIAENISDRCQKEKLTDINDRHIHQSVNATFPRELKQHAQLNCTKDVKAFQKGMISYERTPVKQKTAKSESSGMKRKKKEQRSTPVKPKMQAKVKKSSPKTRRKSPTTVSKKNRKSSPLPKKRKPSKSPKLSPSPKKRRSKSPSKSKKPSKEIVQKMKFASSIISSTPEAFSNLCVRLTREAESNLIADLEDICNALIDTSVSRVTNMEQMGIEDIKGALEELFPPELAEHALLTAFNAISKFLDETQNSYSKN